MQASSSFPTPEPGGGPESSPQTSLPGPSTAPPREPAKRRTALWGTLLALAVLAGGAAFYLNTRANQKVASKSGGIVTIPTVAVAMGGLNETIRVSGTIAAQNFAALLAPRIRGSRGDFNRGGDRGGGGGGGMGDFSLVLLKLAERRQACQDRRCGGPVRPSIPGPAVRRLQGFGGAAGEHDPQDAGQPARLPRKPTTRTCVRPRPTGKARCST